MLPARSRCGPAVVPWKGVVVPRIPPHEKYFPPFSDYNSLHAELGDTPEDVPVPAVEPPAAATLSASKSDKKESHA